MSPPTSNGANLPNLWLCTARTQPELKFPKPSVHDHRGMHSSTDIQIANDTAAAQPLRQYRDRLLRLADVKHMTGLGRSSIYAAIQAGTFPAAVNLTAHAVAWRESEIDAWIAQRPAAATPIPAPLPAAKPKAPRGRAPKASAAQHASA